MNELREYFENHEGRRINKWLHYFEIYEKHFSRFRGQDVTILEIGIGEGGSLQMWRKYFGPQSKIWGLDVRDKCLEFQEEGINIEIGNQADPNFMTKLGEKIGKIDIVIDDGGHRMRQQKVSFKVLFPLISPNGVYLCEDTHTSYWPKFGGGLRKAGTFIEFCKAKIDELNGWHLRGDTAKNTNFTESTKSIHFYDSVVVVEKGPHPKPQSRRR